MRARLWGLGVAAVLAVALSAVAVVGELTLFSGVGPVAGVASVALACVGLSWFVVGGYLVRNRPRHPLGCLFLGVGLLTQLGVAGEIAGRAGWSVWLVWTSSPAGIAVDFVTGLAIFLLLGLLPVLYPTGRVTGRWARAAVVVTVLGAVLAQAQVLRAQLDPTYTWPFGPVVATPQPWWELWLPWLLLGAGVLCGWVFCVVRLVRARHPERQQLAWLLIAVVAVVIAASFGESPLAMVLQAATLLLLPVAVAVGIVRYQLLDIETTVPRVITAGVLVTLVAAAYVAVLAMSGTRLTGEAVPSVIVAAIVAVALLPLQHRLRRLVERFVYGKAADPLRAVADLGTAVAAVPGDDALGTLLSEVAATFRATGARILDDGGRPIAQTGTTAAAALSTPLTVAGEPIGTLELATRPRGERYHRADAEMVRAMSGTIALAVRAATLADELETQRDAVVAASTRARDRLQHDLHDGLGPSLTGLRLGLQALADAHTDADLPRSAQITGVLRDEADRAVVEVRRLIDDMRPLDLEDADLAEALQRRFVAAPGSVAVQVEVGDLLPLPADVEDAVFRVVTEAVANARRHSGAGSIQVGVTMVGHELVARIADDGAGFPNDASPGVGLTSMRSRAAAIGGTVAIDSSASGTVVTLTWPRPVRAETITVEAAT